MARGFLSEPTVAAVTPSRAYAALAGPNCASRSVSCRGTIPSSVRRTASRALFNAPLVDCSLRAAVLAQRLQSSLLFTALRRAALQLPLQAATLGPFPKTCIILPLRSSALLVSALKVARLVSANHTLLAARRCVKRLCSSGGEHRKSNTGRYGQSRCPQSAVTPF